MESVLVLVISLLIIALRVLNIFAVSRYSDVLLDIRAYKTNDIRIDILGRNLDNMESRNIVILKHIFRELVIACVPFIFIFWHSDIMFFVILSSGLVLWSILDLITGGRITHSLYRHERAYAEWPTWIIKYEGHVLLPAYVPENSDSSVKVEFIRKFKVETRKLKKSVARFKLGSSKLEVDIAGNSEENYYIQVEFIPSPEIAVNPPKLTQKQKVGPKKLRYHWICHFPELARGIKYLLSLRISVIKEDKSGLNKILDEKEIHHSVWLYPNILQQIAQKVSWIISFIISTLLIYLLKIIIAI